MYDITLSVVLISAVRLLPVSGRSTTPIFTSTETPEEFDSHEDDLDEEDDIYYAVRYIWPILFSIFAALIFAVVYSCSKKNKCKRSGRSGSSSQRSPNGPRGSQSANDFSNFTNGGFDGDLPNYPGTAFGEGPATIEMIPPPYCDKPPDYSDLFDETSMSAANLQIDESSPEMDPERTLDQSQSEIPTLPSYEETVTRAAAHLSIDPEQGSIGDPSDAHDTLEESGVNSTIHSDNQLDFSHDQHQRSSVSADL